MHARVEKIASTPGRPGNIQIGRLRRDRGISVARPSVLGNPYKIGVDGDRAEVIAKYRKWLARELKRNDAVKDAMFRIANLARHGKITLLCHCAPAACHAEVVAEYAEDYYGD